MLQAPDRMHLVQEMFEEYFKAANAQKTPSKTFRLQVWLYKAEEQTVIFHEETPHSSRWLL